MCVCGGADSQHHIIQLYSHKDMIACKDKHVALLKRRSRDISAKRYQAAPYDVYLDFTLRASEESGAYMSWTGIFDLRLLEQLEELRPVFGGQRDTITTALVKESRELPVVDCIRELHRIQHRLMQAISGGKT